MSKNPAIFINHLSYAIHDKVLFKDLSLTLTPKKIGLVGRNGVGKSTLLKLIAKIISPSAGNINVQGNLLYAEQEAVFNKNDTVVDFLGIGEKYRASQRILSGSICEEDFLILDDDWMLEARIKKQLKLFGLEYLSPMITLDVLSGGEKTRLALSRCFAAEKDFILLDEPTNHLDRIARQLLYQAIQGWSGGLLIASHDRELLELMDEIIEINPGKISCYGGNFSLYQEQKNQEITAKLQQLEVAKNPYSKQKK